MVARYREVRGKNFSAFARFLKPTQVVTGFAVVEVGLTHSVITSSQVELHINRTL